MAANVNPPYIISVSYHRNTTTGLCAEGYYCPNGSSVAQDIDCPIGHYCPEGSDSPVPCQNGTFSDNLRLTSQVQYITIIPSQCADALISMSISLYVFHFRTSVHHVCLAHTVINQAKILYLVNVNKDSIVLKGRQLLHPMSTSALQVRISQL